jgi:hypothetical protein
LLGSTLRSGFFPSRPKTTLRYARQIGGGGHNHLSHWC